MSNHQLSYDALMLEASFHDVWDEWNETLYWALIDYLWAVMPSFGKAGGSRNSHEIRLSVMPGVGLLISPCLWTNTTNIGIWRGSIHMYANIFRVIFSGYFTSFLCGVSWHGISWFSHDLCRLKLMFPMNK